jgi:hypothetical protein
MFFDCNVEFQKTMNLTKFNLRDAVKILLDQDGAVLFKNWTLARLMAWMCLDQRPGTRKRNPRTGRRIQPNRQRRDAKLAGHLALASIISRRFKPGEFDGSDEAVRLFAESGGFQPFLHSPRGGRRWLRRMGEATDELGYVQKNCELFVPI